MENDIVVKNYAEFVKVPKFEKKEKRIFTAEEIASLWKCSDQKPVQAVLFMIYTGFRIGEVLALRVEDVHLSEGYIIGGEKTEAGKDFIFGRIWGSDSESEPQTLTVHIKWLRQKIEKDPKNPERILTVWGKGYRWEG